MRTPFRSQTIEDARCCWCGAEAGRPVVPHGWFCKRCGQWQQTREAIEAAKRGAEDVVLRMGAALARLADA